jgi:RHS repeat-associated protein
MDWGKGGLIILEENHYYPFGLKHEKYNSDKYEYVEISKEDGGYLIGIEPLGPQQRKSYQYKYNGKEFQDELGLNFYDYGARNYDPAIGRWMNIDPLAETSRRFSPYAYALNNPVYFIDPDGMMARASENEGWIEQDKNGERVMTYVPGVNNVNQANDSGYTKVTNVYESATLQSTSGDYSYDLNADGSVTNTADGSQVEFHKRVPGGAAFETPSGTKIYSTNSELLVRPQSGAIEPMGFSSPFFALAVFLEAYPATPFFLKYLQAHQLED